MRATLLGLLTACLLLTGCGDDDDTVADATDTATETSTEVDTTSATADGSTSSSSSTTPAPSGELPGERLDIFPYEGAVLAVVGVESDDGLNVRDAPGPGAEVAFELAPLAEGITPTGHNRQLDDGSIWAEITAGGETGWANTAFLSHLGGTDDVTSQLYPEVADRPRADTMLQLGEAVAAAVGGSEEPQPRVVVVEGPSVGDLGEVTVDVIGFPDDAALGARLRVFGEPDPGGESFTVRSVESTSLCRRGVSDGLCV